MSRSSDIVLLGAGSVHLDVLRRFALRRPWHARLTVVSPGPEIPLPAAIPGLVRGDLPPSEACIDLGRLCAAAGARLIQAAPVGLDLTVQAIAIAERPPLRFDVLSVDLEGESVMPAPHHAFVPTHPLSGFLSRLGTLEARLPAGARLAVIGGDTVGPQLALAVAQRWHGRLRPVLVSNGAEPVANAPPRVRRLVRAALVAAGVELVSGVRAGPLVDGRLALSDGSFLPVDAALWAEDVRPPGCIVDTGLPCDATGRLLVDATQRSVAHPAVFATGACAAPPRDGSVASLLATNLRRVAAGHPPRRPAIPWPTLPDRPALLELAPGRAVVWSNGVALSGKAVARGNAWLSRRRLIRYTPGPVSRPALDLPWSSPVLPWCSPVLPWSSPDQRWFAVGGIGRFRQPLSERLPAKAQSELSAPVAACQPNQVAAITPPPGQAVLQTAASLQTHRLLDPFLLGNIAASHALAEPYALGAQPWTAFAIVSLPADPTTEHARVDLEMMLAGGQAVLAEAGCRLAGVHATLAPQTSLGFIVTALTEPAQLPRRRKLRAGDALLLTKPLGSAVVLAAHPRAEARAAWLTAAAIAMRATNAASSRILRAHGMSACAVVDGAGLGGHLGALLGAAGLSAVLWPEVVPLLPGTLDLMSSPRRRKAAPAPMQADETMFKALLAAPEISGGLIAGVPPARAEHCVAACGAAGVAAAIIGVVQPAEAGAPLIRLARR
ncbi:MAG TPA: selenide, water dikinase SelD [Acetobacteraceae bacterium]|nr:selenide, water dikinase SelD [Acetobacteraceae bacterium]